MSRRRSRRAKAPDRIGRIVAPLPRFLAGMACLPPFLLSESLAVKAVLAAMFAGMALAAGKRIRWSYFLILGASICFFHLLAPWGRVLWEIGPLVITAGALENGVGRALTLMGMVFLSVAVVRPELRLPGRLGGILGRTFYHFEVLIDGKAALDRKRFLQSLDDFLLDRFPIDGADFGAPTESPGSGLSGTPDRRMRGWPLAVAVAMASWIFWLAPLLAER